MDGSRAENASRCCKLILQQKHIFLWNNCYKCVKLQDCMVKDSIDIQPPFAKKKREFVSENQSVYTQRREFDKKGLLEKEIWQLDNGTVVIDLDDGAYISKRKAEELRFLNIESPALMNLAKKEGYLGKNGRICFTRGKGIYYSSEVVEINPPFEEDFEQEYDISKDLKDL